MPYIAGRDVGPTGFGLMSLTPPSGLHDPVPKAQAFEAMAAALESGANFWNGGQFYGTPEYNSLHLLRDYFECNPFAADQVVLSIKGGLTAQKTPDGSRSFVRASVEECIRILPQSLKKIDLFECARVDPDTPIETTMEALKELVDEGKIGAVGLSEVSANTIERANAVVPIAAVEVEFSMFETAILDNSVASTCKQLGIPIVAYSPLGRGLLTNKITKSDEIPQNLRRLDKLQGQNLDHNMRLVQTLQQLSKEYSTSTMAQLAMSWLRQISGREDMPIIVPISGSSKAANVKANAVHLELGSENLAKIDRILKANMTIGRRSYAGQQRYIEG